MTVTDVYTYCEKADETAVITFGSSTSQKKTLGVKDLPITVERGYHVKDTSQDFPIGDRCILYNVTVKFTYTPDRYAGEEQTLTAQFYGPIERIFVDYSQWNQEGGYRQSWYVVAHGRNNEECTSYSQNHRVATSPNMVRQEPYTLVDVVPADTTYIPPTPPYIKSKKTYYISFDKDNRNVYLEESDTEFTYNVSCDSCPPGTLKCSCTDYPGYCCMPCEPPRQELQAIRSTIHLLNKGAVSRG